MNTHAVTIRLFSTWRLFSQSQKPALCRHYVAVESALNWCTLYCQVASGSAWEGEGEGREAVAYTSPFPFPCEKYESSLSNRGTVSLMWLFTVTDGNFTHLILPTLLIATVWTHRECVLSVVFAKDYTDNTHWVMLDCYHISNFVSVEWKKSDSTFIWRCTV